MFQQYQTFRSAKIFQNHFRLCAVDFHMGSSCVRKSFRIFESEKRRFCRHFYAKRHLKIGT